MFSSCFPCQVEGAITVQPLAYDVRGFKDYFFSLSPKTNHRNPWFIEYWEHHFQCKYPNSSWTPYNENYDRLCSGVEVINPNNFHLEAQLQFVSDAAMAFAHAFRVSSDIPSNLNRLIIMILIFFQVWIY